MSVPVHPNHTSTPRNDFVSLQKLMENVKRCGPAKTTMSPEEVEAEEARRFEEHAKGEAK
jgi:hypothetical protein